MTKYQVLKQAPAPSALWAVAAIVEAHSADAAIRQHVASVENAQEAGGTFVAVPAKQWKPRTIEITTHTRVQFSEPSKPGRKGQEFSISGTAADVVKDAAA